MTDGELEQFKKTLETKEYSKAIYLDELFKRYWEEIQSRLYNFNRHEIEIEQLRSIKLADLLAFFMVSKKIN